MKDFKELKKQFVGFLKSYDKPLIVILDSLDQLRDGDSGLKNWIPTSLAENVTLVLSTIPGEKYAVEPQLRVCTV